MAGLIADRVRFEDERLCVDFAQPFGVEDYELFLRTKRLPESEIVFDEAMDAYRLAAPARFARLLGIEAPVVARPWLELPGHLFDYQRWIVQMALAARKFCIWADCGLGKTPMLLEFARQAQAREGGKFLIFSPRKVIPQTMREAVKFYGGDLPMHRIESREELKTWCKAKDDGPWLGITNYEKMVPSKESPEQVVNELRYLTGVALDESSILKTKGGTIKWAVMKSTYGVPFKLSCTATPAPNDALEYLSQAGFLDKFNDNTGQGAALASYFKLEADGTCKLKPHAREPFFRFMAAWSIYLRKPSAFGFVDPFANVPEPEILPVKVAPTAEQLAAAVTYQRRGDPTSLLPRDKLGVVERNKLSQIAKGFLYRKADTGNRIGAVRIPSRKPMEVARLVRRALAEGRRPLVWTVFDEESEIIMELLRDTPVEALHGKMKDEECDAILGRYVDGRCRGLVSKASLLGYGLNFPFCTCMIFSGFDDSFERFYQAVRRGYRYGAKSQLKVFVPFVPGLEDHMWENILRKRAQWEGDIAQQERNYVAELGRAA